VHGVLGKACRSVLPPPLRIGVWLKAQVRSGSPETLGADVGQSSSVVHSPLQDDVALLQ
jgi:hypothetical protein